MTSSNRKRTTASRRPVAFAFAERFAALALCFDSGVLLVREVDVERVDFALRQHIHVRDRHPEDGGAKSEVKRKRVELCIS